MPKLLVLEPDPHQRTRIEMGIHSRLGGLEIVFAGTLEAAKAALKDGSIGGVLSSNAFPEREEGAMKSAADLLRHAKEGIPMPPVVVHDESLSASQRTRLIAQGAMGAHDRNELVSRTLPLLRKLLGRA